MLTNKTYRMYRADGTEEVEVCSKPKRIAGGSVVWVRRTPGQYMAGTKFETPTSNVYDPETGKQARL